MNQLLAPCLGVGIQPYARLLIMGRVQKMTQGIVAAEMLD